MLAKTLSAGVLGIEAYPVHIEVDTSLGLPQYNLVGLADSAVKEGAVRVRAALENSGFALPPRRVTINLAPADVRKDGAAFDLPIALALLVALELLPEKSLDGKLWLGELGLDGSIRRISGCLPVALRAQKEGISELVLPADCATEAAAIRDLTVYAASSLRQVVEMLQGGAPLPRAAERPLASSVGEPSCDLSDVRGNEQPKRALMIAAAGGHNLLMLGPPGTGKSMLARRLVSILPPMSESEALTTTAIYSAAGLLSGQSLLQQRPFRAPHHEVSVVGLVGGGSNPRPGEISLAHHGVLFLDELPEFPRAALESLRQPLEERQITIVRARCSVTYPASFSLIAAMNPCPCGFRGSSLRTCRCDLGVVSRYLSRLSGPLLDRFDLHIEVPHVEYQTLLDARRSGVSSASVRDQVMAARAMQQERVETFGPFAHSNATLSPDAVVDVGKPDAAGEKLLLAYAKKHVLSNRAVHRVLRVARTVADLSQERSVGAAHIAEALSLRILDRPGSGIGSA